ncbi:MAG: TonB-dependent receptor [Pseudomonadota bacterium]
MNRKVTAVAAATAMTIAILNQTALAQEESAPLEEVVVIGSRIPRTNQQGPAPVTTIGADEIESQGLTSVPDVLRALTQNAGATQSQQSFNAADFTPGAEQVDLRGLGPNHTLVLVNGRRIADFPLPFQGLSNFTDISNIPLGMIDKVEVLSGSASAIYGSDAISGVVNFVLKEHVDGFELDYRAGTPEDSGGGQSQRFSLAGGWSSGDFNAVFGVELLDQKPLWAFDRAIQDSTADSPTTESPLARRVFLRYDPNEDAYVDPGQATCDALSDLNKGTTYYGSRPRYGLFDEDLDDYGPGRYCGSNESIGYGTVRSERRGATAYASLSLELNESTTLFADIMIGTSKVKVFKDVTDWQFQDENGSEDGNFFNDSTGALDSWYRQFTPEEMGGLERGMVQSDQTTITVTPGVKGHIGEDWNYEAYLNHSQYKLRVSWPQIIAANANALFLGAQTGVDEDSEYPSFDADVARLYTPLTRQEYDSIATRTVYHPEAKNDYLSLTLTNGSLWDLPAGAVGFAANVEAGTQSYDLNPDPRALTYYYYSWRDQDGHGSRKHYGASYEFRLPVFKTLELSTAGRYDSYNFAGGDVGKFTYNLGLEFRPIDSLLLRGYYGTGFRAPDLHYVFAGEGNVHPSANDYYLCRTEEPDEDIDDCSFSDTGIVSTRTGNRNLKPETSTSFGAGVVWAPSENFDVSVDYFKIDLDDEVVDIDIDKLLQAEADCRIGETTNGTAIDVNSPTCVDTLARVTRYPLSNPLTPGELFGVRVNPINVANESTSGVDFAFRYKLPVGAASLTFTGGYTKVFDHETQQFPGDPIVDEFRVDSGFDIPRSKANASVTLAAGAWTSTLYAQRLDRLPNYDEEAFIDPSILVNASIGYQLSDAASMRLTVDNLLDEAPEVDPTYAGYPYYDISWFDSVGRSFFLSLSYKFGGK